MTFYTIPLLVAAAMSATLAGLAWQRRHVVGAMPFAALMVAVTVWTLMYALELESATLRTKLLWVKAQYPGIVFVPVAWLAFSLEYTGRERWVTPRRLALLAIVPLITLALVWTNAAHGLMARSARLVARGGDLMLDFSRGPAFWLHVAYSYGLILLGTFLLLRYTTQSSPAYRKQTRALVIAALFPWLGNILYVFNVGPFSHVDVSSLAFTLTGVAVFWALFRFRFLELVPVARNAVIENMEDGLLVMDARGRVADINPAAGRVLGVDEAEVVGQPASEVFSAWPEVVAKLEPFSEGSAEIVIRDAEDRRFYELRISPLRRDRNGFLGGLISMRDVTDRKRVEEALHRRALELEARNDELHAFARTVAHDLKGPLTSVVGYAEILEEYYGPELDEEMCAYLHTISQKGRKMASIIEELLLLASVRQGQDVDMAVLDMGRIVAEAVDRVEELIERHEAEIVTPEAWPAALGYGSWVEEVWVNYLSNAVKYGGRPPRVELGADRGEDGTVCFWVRDSGAGLTAEEQEQLFTPFTQLDRTSATGHGLGLSIVRWIVSKLDGQVGVESEVGEGSVFSFTLKAADAADLPMGRCEDGNSGRWHNGMR